MKSKTDIEQYINANGLEKGSNTPDWILAEFVGEISSRWQRRWNGIGASYKRRENRE